MIREITVPATFDEIVTVTDFVNESLTALGCEKSVRIQVDVAIDEIFSNIVRYAYAPESGPVSVRVEEEENPPCVIITFIDHGTPFDPLTAKTPDTTLPARKRPIGGLGLFMVKKTMDGISYRYQDGQNILTIRKKI